MSPGKDDPFAKSRFIINKDKDTFTYLSDEIRDGLPKVIHYRDIPMDLKKIPRMYWVVWAKAMGIKKITCHTKSDLMIQVIPHLPKVLQTK